MTTTTPQQAVDALGLTVRAVFVPFSQSRNKDERGNPRLSLNWTVTLVANGRDILTTDYSAGAGHCPSYSSKAPAAWNESPRNWQPKACAFECEKGHRAAWSSYLGFGSIGKPIEPKPLDVIYSLVQDSSVLDSGGFEEWASELGYDTDSRKAESVYRACLEIALKLRNGIGESGLEALRNAFQDY